MFGPVSEGMRIFKKKGSVAVVGYSDKPNRVVGKISLFLQEQGNTIIGINPRLLDAAPGPIPIHATLQDLPQPVEIIQVFRNSSALPGLGEEILKLSWKPKLVWCQQGVVDFLFQQRLEKAGILVVMDACPYALRTFL